MAIHWIRKILKKGRGDRIPPPREAYFLMIDKCNARCSMCQDDFFRHSGAYLSLVNFRIIAKNIHLESMESIVLSGGDPLLNKDLPGILSLLSREYSSVNVIISTNGIALTNRNATLLIANNIRSLNISLNAATPEVYRKVMQVDHFRMVIDNIRNFQNLSRGIKNPPDLNLSFVANRKNIEDLPDFIRLAKDVGADSVSCTYCRFFPLELRKSLDFDNDNLLKDSDSLFFHQGLSDRIVMEAKTLADHLGVRFQHEPLFSETVPPQKCTFPCRSILVGITGEIYPCCGGEVIFKQKVNDKIYDFGNALTQDTSDFWYNNYFRALRYSVMHPDKPAVPECNVCSNNLMWNGHMKKAHIMDWSGISDNLIQFDLIGDQ